MVKLWYRLGCDPLMFCWKLAQKAVLFIEGWGCWSGEAVQCCTKRAFVARIASAPKKTSNAKWASLVQCGAKLLFHDFMKAAVCRSRFHETWQHRTGMLYAVCRTVCPYVLVIHNSWEFHFIPILYLQRSTNSSCMFNTCGVCSMTHHMYQPTSLQASTHIKPLYDI